MTLRKSHRRRTLPVPVPFRSALLCLLSAALAAGASPAERAAPRPAVPDNIAPHPAPPQPLPFSHETHVAAAPSCGSCHVNPDPGTRMTFPDTSICMSCHDTIAANRPAIRRLREYSESCKAIPWVRIYPLTPGVLWSHRSHLAADVQCETCHGDISKTAAVAETKAIRAMASCIGCHEARAASTQCVSCHAWPTDEILGAIR